MVLAGFLLLLVVERIFAFPPSKDPNAMIRTSHEGTGSRMLLPPWAEWILPALKKALQL